VSTSKYLEAPRRETSSFTQSKEQHLRVFEKKALRNTSESKSY